MEYTKNTATEVFGSHARSATEVILDWTEWDEEKENPPKLPSVFEDNETVSTATSQKVSK